MCAASAALAASDSGSAPLNTAQTDANHPVDTALVKLDGETLFQVRGMAGYSAQERAEAISNRIQAVAANKSISPSQIAIVEQKDHTELTLNGERLANILDGDADAEHMPRSIMAEAARRNMVRAIEDYRHDRSPKILLRRSAVAGVATILLFLLVLGIRGLFRWLMRVAERQVKVRMESLEARSSKAVEAGPVWAAFVGAIKMLRGVLIAVAAYAYLNSVLGLFPWTRPLASQLFSLFIAPLKILAKDLVDSFPDFVFLAVLFVVVRYTLKVTKLLFTSIQQGTIKFQNFDSDWAWPTYRILRLLIICFSVVIAYPYIPGSNSGAFKGISLFVGLLFSLGSTSFIANSIAGVALTYRRAFKVGDIIKVGEVMGLVTEVRMQATYLRTIYNEAIAVPNTNIVNSHVINYTALAKLDGLALHTTVGIGYETPWRQVEAMLFMAADRTPGIRKDKKGFIRQLSLGDFAVAYELSVYCSEPRNMFWVYSDLHRNILDVFNEFGVQIMTPAYVRDPETPKVVPKDQTFAAPAEKLSTSSASFGEPHAN
jgi:small-conductance mechanosensitive channel